MSRRTSAHEAPPPGRAGQMKSPQGSMRESLNGHSAQQLRQQPEESTSRSLHEGNPASTSLDRASSEAVDPLQQHPVSSMTEGKKHSLSPHAVGITSAQVSVGSPPRDDVELHKHDSGWTKGDPQRPESESPVSPKRAKSDVAPWMTQRHKRAIRRSLKSSSRSTLSSHAKGSSSSGGSTKQAAKETSQSSPPRS